jgi:hypothetical protein
LIRCPATGARIMATLKGYFDESGKEDDPQFADSAIAAAGYVTPAESWIDIETKWNGVLANFAVPYLHMREFAHSQAGSPFETWKNNETKRREFIAELIGVIQQSDLHGFGAIIRLPDLRRFNHQFGLNLRAYPLAIYACTIELFKKFPEIQIEAFWDRVRNHSREIQMAQAYADTDTYYRNCRTAMKALPLNSALNSNKIPALQIADLAAYELLKSHREKNEWYLQIAPTVNAENRFESLHDWTVENALKQNKLLLWPCERRSYLALFGDNNARPMEGCVWEYNALVQSHKIRNGVWSPQNLAKQAS